MDDIRAGHEHYGGPQLCEVPLELRAPQTSRLMLSYLRSTLTCPCKFYILVINQLSIKKSSREHKQHHLTNDFSVSRLWFLCKLYAVGVSLFLNIPCSQQNQSVMFQPWVFLEIFYQWKYLVLKIFQCQNKSLSASKHLVERYVNFVTM